MGYTGEEDEPSYYPARLRALRRVREAGFKVAEPGRNGAAAGTPQNAPRRGEEERNDKNSASWQRFRQEYNNLFGPTVGDKIRLGDTDLYVEIEKDLRVYGDEAVYGGGKDLCATAWGSPIR